MAGKAWLVSAVGEVRTYGGHDGYVDDPETTYRWDNKVGNHGRPQRGDYIVVRNKDTSLGYSVIESIHKSPGEKTIKYCPKCANSEINYRTTLGTYRCTKKTCHEEFRVPDSKIVPVIQYEAWYGIGFVPLPGAFSRRELIDMCENNAGRESIREISWSVFADGVVDKTGKPPLNVVTQRHNEIAGGHTRTTVRIRIGQRAFRQKLLKAYGDVCAFTGPCAREALDAAHLYSYAQHGEHHEHGGLLLRKDLHSLFDRGLLAVEPDTHLLRHRGLGAYPQYAMLDAVALHVDLKPDHIKWLHLHWNQYRR